MIFSLVVTTAPHRGHICCLVFPRNSCSLDSLDSLDVTAPSPPVTMATTVTFTFQILSSSSLRPLRCLSSCLCVFFLILTPLGISTSAPSSSACPPLLCPVSHNQFVLLYLEVLQDLSLVVLNLATDVGIHVGALDEEEAIILTAQELN